MTVRSQATTGSAAAMHAAAALLEEARVPAPSQELRWLVERVTGRTAAERLRDDVQLDADQTRALLELAARRAAGEPLQYLTGIAGFRGLDLRVGPGVFIPRPETERVVDVALEALRHEGTLVDVGTGSGAIAVAVAHERPDARVLATEVSSAAAGWARTNIERHAPAVTLLEGDLFDPLPVDLAGSVDVVVSNPPYIPPSESSMLAREVVDHEPHEALFAADNGLRIIERLAVEAPRWLRRGGAFVIEIDERQEDLVRVLLEATGYVAVEVGRDLADRARVASARTPQ